ncbi:hypothetical protein M413DRAFT_29884 [Hebeloma cylindrosporum]|uniref:Uncharacterized protein n=1 Tax=Hebeloma cylindrosporum TaxID=76867 RepID=A0A0C2YCD0_HEBCY|nr:hypothetical protein M413DRAFT_29884 [Hebeloma cylindrosporum h7]
MDGTKEEIFEYAKTAQRSNETQTQVARLNCRSLEIIPLQSLIVASPRHDLQITAHGVFKLNDAWDDPIAPRTMTSMKVHGFKHSALKTPRFSTVEDGNEKISRPPIVVCIAIRPNATNARAVRDVTPDILHSLQLMSRSLMTPSSGRKGIKLYDATASDALLYQYPNTIRSQHFIKVIVVEPPGEFADEMALRLRPARTVTATKKETAPQQAIVGSKH